MTPRRWLEHYATPSTPSRSTTRSTGCRDQAVRGWVERASRLPLRGEDEPVHHAYPEAGRPRDRIPLLRAHRASPPRRSSARSSGSSRRPSGERRQPGGSVGGAPGGRHAFEFRHPTWYSAEVYELLRGPGCRLVIPDSPKYPFRELELTADWTFVRFHYDSGANGNYSETEIAEWAERIDAGVKTGSTSTRTTTTIGRATRSRTGCGCGAARRLGCLGMQPTPEQITEALGKVYDPELKKPVTELGMVRDVDVRGSHSWSRSRSPCPAVRSGTASRSRCSASSRRCPASRPSRSSSTS